MGDGIHSLSPMTSPQNSGADIVGSFGIGAAGAVDADDLKGKGFSVTYDATGRYTISLRRHIYEIQSVSVDIESASTVDVTLQVRSIDNASAQKSVTIQAHTAGTGADPASGARIHFRVHCARSVSR